MPEPINTDSPETMPAETTGMPPMPRRSFLLALGIGINVVAAGLFAMPLIGYLLAPARKKEVDGDFAWVPLGSLEQFPAGQTRFATYRNPFARPWDGDTAKTACWVRRIGDTKFQVFAVNCTHLGCPVRWFPQSGLFLCPCHGGAYYENGERASGPPPRGLFEHEYRLEHDQLFIRTGQQPTLAQPLQTSVSRAKGKSCG
jgi:menaquinol-cytochrome c reductase iron-sulfur subunit